MQLERARETETERLLDRDVQEAELLELLRPAKRPDVDRPQATVRDQLRELLLRSRVVPGDQDVELLSADLSRNERRREGRVERLQDRRPRRDEPGNLLGRRAAGWRRQPVPRVLSPAPGSDAGALLATLGDVIAFAIAAGLMVAAFVSVLFVNAAPDDN